MKNIVQTERKGIYAFSGDPITCGHVDIIQRAASIFDKLYVGIGVNPEKKYTFTLDERTEMAKISLSRMKNVKVISFSGLLVDYAYENKIPTVVKGLRNREDFDYELLLHQTGDSQKLGIDTFFIPAKQNLLHISSTTVKFILKEQGLIDEFVPLNVKQKLEEKLLGQHIWSLIDDFDFRNYHRMEYLTELRRVCGLNNFPLHIIDVDEICSNFEGEKTNNGINDVLFKIRKQSYGKKGLIFLNYSKFYDSKLFEFTNNRACVIRPKFVDKDFHCTDAGLVQRIENVGWGQIVEHDDLSKQGIKDLFENLKNTYGELK